VTYLLDTNTCIDYLKGVFPAVRRHVLALRPAEIGIPAIVRAELLYGAYKSERLEKNLLALRQFLQPFSLAGFGAAEADHYADIRTKLGRVGTPIGPNDLVIAATARAHKCTLVTHNTSEFGRVPGLAVEDWTV
jgi:tRNA(fMet)-specific endonuclease VapC